MFTDDFHELLDFVIFHLKRNGIANHAGTEIHEVFDAVRHPKTQVQSAKTDIASDPYEELKKLKDLFDMGVITQEEFDAKKKQLLGL